ncbi:MAG: hypothetical protein HY000_14450 [Planctomycetes bacterium]|nr:hypothetical protein [Planctomycetota bacterium]
MAHSRRGTVNSTLRHHCTAACILVTVTLGARGAYLLTDPRRITRDIDAYGHIARQLVDHGAYAIEGRPTAFRPPLYPLVLALVWKLGGGYGAVAALHLVLGTGTVVLTLALGRRLGLGRFVYLAAALVAVDPLLVHHGALLMTETLFTFLLMFVLFSFAHAVPAGMRGNRGVAKTEQVFHVKQSDDPAPVAVHAQRAGFRATVAIAFGSASRQCGFVGWALLSGILLGVAALCRPSVWAFLPLAIAAMTTSGERQRAGTGRRWHACATIGALLAGTVIAVSPWALRNWRVLGSPVVTTTHGGQTFWRANNAWFYDACIGGGAPVWPDESRLAWEREMKRVTAGLHARAADRVCYREARKTIRSQPGDFAAATGYRLASFWRPWPKRDAVSDAAQPGAGGNRLAVGAQVLIGAFYAVEFVLAFVGLCRRTTWAWPWMLLPALLFSFTLVHAFYWTDMRMRGPLMPAVALLAAAGARSIAQPPSRRAGERE